MNGPQDLGGQMGFGPIAPEANEPVFHARWEGRALGLTLCAGAMGQWSLDETRHCRESLPPADYYASSYYEIWTKALERLLLRHGFITPEELASGGAVGPGTRPRRILKASDVPSFLHKGSPFSREIEDGARFAVGQSVRTRVMHPTGHTRLPRYARGKLGVVAAVHDGYVFPDRNAHGKGESPQRLYTIAFAATELWGDEADPTVTVSIDAWESYLEAA